MTMSIEEFLVELEEEEKKGKYAKATDKSDDGEGMDPPGEEDSDIDNDGDSDDSDEYLSNRRKAIKKAMKEAFENLDEDAKNFKSAVEMIKKADTVEKLEKHEKGFERVYKSGFLTPKEYARLDDMIMTKMAKLEESVELDEQVDQVALRELELFIDNDYPIYRQRESIEKNIQRKVKSGKYDHSMAAKLWQYMVDAGAKKYVKEFGGNVRDMFPKQLRMALAKQYADDYKEENLD
jgi:hypothetical protein